jgi:hypothetical protein
VRVPTNAPLSHLHTQTHDPHECTRTRTHTRTRTRTRTHTHTPTHTHPRTSIRPLLGCAGHFLPSDLRRPARSCDQVRRVVDPSSQPHAPRRIRCTRWPDEGSALEMAHSDDDRSHSKGHDRSSRRSRTLQRPCDRLAAEQLAALVTGRAHCPVCGAHGTSVAQLEEPRYLWTL